MSKSDIKSDLDQLGFSIVKRVFLSSEISEMIEGLPSLGTRAGTRSVLDFEVGQKCARDERICQLVTTALGAPAVAVRAILFDKTPNANWTLGWHQDTKITVRERKEVEGYTSWSTKEGIVHCQPPVQVLENCVSVRIHLDDCTETNGPLQVLPGSHRQGFSETFTETHPTKLICDAGDVVLMKPLLLHASSKSETPNHRRVIHIEYCSVNLDGGLYWTYAVQMDDK